MNLGPTGGIIATLNRFVVVVDLLIDFNNDEIQLQQFRLTDIGYVIAQHIIDTNKVGIQYKCIIRMFTSHFINDTTIKINVCQKHCF